MLNNNSLDLRLALAARTRKLFLAGSRENSSASAQSLQRILCCFSVLSILLALPTSTPAGLPFNKKKTATATAAKKTIATSAVPASFDCALPPFSSGVGVGVAVGRVVGLDVGASVGAVEGDGCAVSEGSADGEVTLGAIVARGVVQQLTYGIPAYCFPDA